MTNELKQNMEVDINESSIVLEYNNIDDVLELKFRCSVNPFGEEIEDEDCFDWTLYEYLANR
ncbi:hypothetical protein [Oceanobacillus sp. FSL H7-0719]|uniref:hypothetical protein n=1 Tax=Oceanobacillus sp. FSL H7-0719 TaxID=2954507 RepID=UPI003254E9E7